MAGQTGYKQRLMEWFLCINLKIAVCELFFVSLIKFVVYVFGELLIRFSFPACPFLSIFAPHSLQPTV